MAAGIGGSSKSPGGPSPTGSPPMLRPGENLTLSICLSRPGISHTEIAAPAITPTVDCEKALQQGRHFTYSSPGIASHLVGASRIATAVKRHSTQTPQTDGNDGAEQAATSMEPADRCGCGACGAMQGLEFGHHISIVALKPPYFALQMQRTPHAGMSSIQTRIDGGPPVWAATAGASSGQRSGPPAAVVSVAAGNAKPTPWPRSLMSPGRFVGGDLVLV
jgi:hypothetical protein